MKEAAEQAEELDTLVGTTLAERYRVDALLGRGGMGSVFRAHHLLLKRDVAIKVLHPEFVSNDDISKRFDREAQSAARLDHPNVIPVTEFGSTSTGMKYMVMQLLSGRELTDLLIGPLAPLRAIELEVQILLGLEHAHSKGVVHRDLKPENVFVTVDHDGKEVLKLVDFGIAKITDDDDPTTGKPLTRLGLVFGTPHYMSPEQSTGSPVDQRTDIYSAGVLLYQMLAGQLPFDHEDPVALIRMQVTVDPPPLPESIPAELARVVSMMMAKTRDQRYPDARSARKALQAVQAKLSDQAGVPFELDDDTGVVDQQWHAQTLGSSAIPATLAIPSKTVTFADTLTQPRPVLGVAMLAAIPRKVWYVSGSVLGILLLIALWPNNDDEDPDVEGDAIERKLGGGPATKANIAKIPILDGNTTDEATLIAIDHALTSKNESAALDLIRPARDQFPEDPQLLWREGKALGMARAKTSKVTALERYGQAFERDPTLIENPDFYGELHVLLRNTTLQDQAINVALQKLGPSGHKFLLELVNVDDPTKMLGWVDRHRILTELGEHPEASERVDWRLNLARDLYQAIWAPKPCTAFRDTLEQIDRDPDVYFVEHLHNAKLAPPIPTGNDPEDTAVCAKLDDELITLRESLAAAHPTEAAKFR